MGENPIHKGAHKAGVTQRIENFFRYHRKCRITRETITLQSQSAKLKIKRPNQTCAKLLGTNWDDLRAAFTFTQRGAAH